MNEVIKIVGNNLWRGGEKIGWIENEKIFDHTGRKAGFFMGEHIYNADGDKIGYILGDEIHSTTNSRVIRLEDNHEEIQGGEVSDICRAAIRLLLGD